MKVTNSAMAVVFLLMAICAAPAHAQRYCSDSMLSGDYSFRITGQILTGPLAGLANGVAVVSFDGNGKLSSKDHVVINGLQPQDEWRDSTGTYTVNPNCTGKAQITFADGRIPPITYYFILTSFRLQL